MLMKLCQTRHWASPLSIVPKRLFILGVTQYESHLILFSCGSFEFDDALPDTSKRSLFIKHRTEIGSYRLPRAQCRDVTNSTQSIIKHRQRRSSCPLFLYPRKKRPEATYTQEASQQSQRHEIPDIEKSGISSEASIIRCP